MKLTDLFETKIKILNEKEAKDGSMKILAPFIQTGRKNKNGRLYGYDLIHWEITRLQPSIKAGAMISSADHPFTPHTSLANASHIITKLELDKNGKGWMEATVLPNEKGKNIMTIIKAGGQLGISARGVGDVSPSGTVENNYKLLGCDIVTSPAEPTATFNKDNICESLEFEEQEDGKTVVEKLTEEAASARVLSFYREAQAGEFRGTLNEWKEEFPQLVEQASKRIKISEEKKEPEPPKKKISESERIFLELKKQNPNSSVTLESVKRMLEKEEEVKADKRIRRKAIITVSKECDGSVNNETLKKMVDAEISALKAARKLKRQKNWEAYKRLLDE